MECRNLYFQQEPYMIHTQPKQVSGSHGPNSFILWNKLDKKRLQFFFFFLFRVSLLWLGLCKKCPHKTLHPKLLLVACSKRNLRSSNSLSGWGSRSRNPQDSAPSSRRRTLDSPRVQPAFYCCLNLPRSAGNCACILQLFATGASAELLG